MHILCNVLTIADVRATPDSPQPLPPPPVLQLVEGLYQFKVTVTGDSGAVGEHSVNVTVLPGKCKLLSTDKLSLACVHVQSLHL